MLLNERTPFFLPNVPLGILTLELSRRGDGSGMRQYDELITTLHVQIRGSCKNMTLGITKSPPWYSRMTSEKEYKEEECYII